MTNILDDLDRSPKPAAPPPTEPSREGWGLFTDIEPAAYFLDPAPQPSLSNSSMDALLHETPLDFAFHHPRLNPDVAKDEAKATAEKRRGDIVHQLALGKGRGYAVGDFKDWRTKDAGSFKERAIADGLTPCLRHQFEEAEIMAEVIREKVKRVLDGAAYETEVVALWQEKTEAGPIWCRAMFDIWCEERATIIDPKVTAQLYDGTIERHAINMGWDRQAALYPHAVGMILPQLAGRVQFADLLVKPSAPFTSRFWGPEKGWDHTSIKQCREAMERFGACFYAGKWPGFGDEKHYGALPVWEAKRREAVELGEAR